MFDEGLYLVGAAGLLGGFVVAATSEDEEVAALLRGFGVGGVMSVEGLGATATRVLLEALWERGLAGLAHFGVSSF